MLILKILRMKIKWKPLINDTISWINTLKMDSNSEIKVNVILF